MRIDIYWSIHRSSSTWRNQKTEFTINKTITTQRNLYSTIKSLSETLPQDVWHFKQPQPWRYCIWHKIIKHQQITLIDCFIILEDPIQAASTMTTMRSTMPNITSSKQVCKMEKRNEPIYHTVQWTQHKGQFEPHGCHYETTKLASIQAHLLLLLQFNCNSWQFNFYQN